MTDKKDNKFVGEPGDKAMPVRIHKDMYLKLRKYSFEHNISIAQICREGIELFFDKKEKEG